MKFIYLVICIPLFIYAEKPLKILHLSFHKGCIDAINTMAHDLNIDVTHWFLREKPELFAPLAKNSAIYDITHTLAAHIWKKNKHIFNQYDAIITSDTAPLARIFLQNNWKKPLIIWVCNRFDYFDSANKRDSEFYTLFREAQNKQNVFTISYTPFEYIYAAHKDVNFPIITIKPYIASQKKNYQSSIPLHIDKSKTFFIPPYHNDTIFMNLSQKCTELGIPNYCGRYSGAADLKEFKGIIHIPYSWSNLALFENIANGVPYFVPSFSFLQKLSRQGNFFHPNAEFIFHRNYHTFSEWYCSEHQEIITYFNSWEELPILIKNTDFNALRKKIYAYAKKHKELMCNRWKAIFQNVIEQTKNTH